MNPHRQHSRRPDRRLLRFLGAHLALGVGAAAVFMAALLGFDVAGFRTLIIASGAPVLAGAMLFIVLSITWGSAAMGTAVFLLPKDEPDATGRGRRSRVSRAMRPLPAPAKVRK
ncbi:MAG: hypothetical protein AAFW81_03890 [Pseudomonadota bacterium]